MSETDAPEPDPDPGPNPLFFGVVAVLLAGVVAGALAGDAELLRSNLVFRLAVGGLVAAVGYVVVVVLWHAWHRRAVKKLTIAGSTLETEAQTQDEIRARDLEVAEFMGTTTNAIEELRRRIEMLEDRPQP